MPPRRASTPRGRPRSLRARRAILAAARALVEKGGYPAATIEAIATRSGVAKTTIYRWWPNRAALVIDLLVELSAEAVPPPGGPEPLEALRTELRLVAGVADTLLGNLLTSLLAEAQHDLEVRARLIRRLFDPRRTATADVVRQAQDSGAFRRDIAPLTAVDLLVGPLFFRMFVRHEPVTQRFAREVFDQLLAGLAPRPRARKPVRRAPPRPRSGRQ